MRHNQRTGKWGEETASEYLSQKGCEIIGHNVRMPYYEIDIVAKQGNCTIFTEVKTRTSNKMRLPEARITARNREHMINCTEHYAMENEFDHWQIDDISFEGKPGSMPKITSFENAIY